MTKQAPAPTPKPTKAHKRAVEPCAAAVARPVPPPRTRWPRCQTSWLAIGLAAALLAFDLLAWRVVAAMFDRERLVTGRRG
jgi:hypothetical protein